MPWIVVQCDSPTGHASHTPQSSQVSAVLEDQGEMINLPTGSPYSTVVRAAEEWAEEVDTETEPS